MTARTRRVPRASSRPSRCGGHCRLQRHRRRHFLRPDSRRSIRARLTARCCWCGCSAARSPLPARWPTPSSRRCGLAPVASTSICAKRSGHSPAFLTGWTSFVAGFSGAIAASAVALAEYLGRFFRPLSDATPIMTMPLPLVPLDRLAEEPGGAVGDRRVDVRASARPWTGPARSEHVSRPARSSALVVFLVARLQRRCGRCRQSRRRRSGRARPASCSR